MAENIGISCEVIDLRSLLPWDAECVTASVCKTGRLVLSDEAPVSEFCHIKEYFLSFPLQYYSVLEVSVVKYYQRFKKNVSYH